MSIHFMGKMLHRGASARRGIDPSQCKRLRGVHKDIVSKTKGSPEQSAAFSKPLLLAARLRGREEAKKYGPRQRAPRSTNRRQTFVDLR